MSGILKSLKENNERLISWVAKFGYISRGVVYIIIGYFAALAISGDGDVKSSKGALGSVLDEPLGTVLLGLVAGGLICYSLWRLIQSVLDTDNHGLEPKGLSIRVGLFASCLTHLSLAWWAISLFSGSGGKEGSSNSSWSAQLAGYPGGELMIAIIALIFFGVGAAHIFKGFMSGFKKNFSKFPGHYLEIVCQIGLITKGIAFLIISYLFILTALNSRSTKNFGVEDALIFTSTLSYGWLVLSAMGFGLIAFGFYSLIEAKYRKVSL